MACFINVLCEAVNSCEEYILALASDASISSRMDYLQARQRGSGMAEQQPGINGGYLTI